jgi:hypothetical protein
MVRPKEWWPQTSNQIAHNELGGVIGCLLQRKRSVYSPQVAAAFIEAYLDTLGDVAQLVVAPHDSTDVSERYSDRGMGETVCSV